MGKEQFQNMNRCLRSCYPVASGVEKKLDDVLIGYIYAHSGHVLESPSKWKVSTLTQKLPPKMTRNATLSSAAQDHIYYICICLSARLNVHLRSAF